MCDMIYHLSEPFSMLHASSSSRSCVSVAPARGENPSRLLSLALTIVFLLFLAYAGSGRHTLPFNEAVDSRHNYKESTLARLYNNRERARDSFMGLLREFQVGFSKRTRERLVKAPLMGGRCGRRENVSSYLDFGLVRVVFCVVSVNFS